MKVRVRLDSVNIPLRESGGNGTSFPGVSLPTACPNRTEGEGVGTRSDRSKMKVEEIRQWKGEGRESKSRFGLQDTYQ